jgi:hypothetical protein
MTHHTLIKFSIAVAFLAAGLILRQLDNPAVDIIADSLGIFGLVVIIMAGFVSLGHRDAEDHRPGQETPVA